MTKSAKLSRQILALKKYLECGDSISLSLSKAGIHQRMHTDYLKNPDYKAMIDKYKQATASPVDHYIRKMEAAKKFMC